LTGGDLSSQWVLNADTAAMLSADQSGTSSERDREIMREREREREREEGERVKERGNDLYRHIGRLSEKTNTLDTSWHKFDIHPALNAPSLSHTRARARSLSPLSLSVLALLFLSVLLSLSLSLSSKTSGGTAAFSRHAHILTTCSCGK
jgi:hypothetical protein